MEFIRQNGLTYEDKKTPFFEISVGDSTGKKLVPLPHHILRLVDKVEILETFEPGGFNTIIITFIEGSREPGSPDASLGTQGLYKIPKEGTEEADVDIAGSLTNRTGVIADLRFSGNGGITFLTQQEKRQQAIDTSLQQNVNGDIVRRSYPRENKRPTLLFQERNQVKVRWGYREDPNTVRAARGYIMVVSVSYPETGPVTTTITCQDTGSALDQIATAKGVKFGTRISTGKGSITQFSDDTTDAVIRDICDKAGIGCIVSTDLPVPSLDSKHQKVWLAGESFHQFMSRLAKRHNCYYRVQPHPETGVDTLIFVKKTDFERRVRLDRNLLTYKAPNSLLKSVEIKVDFGQLQGAAQKGIDQEGSDKIEISETASEQLIVHKNPGGSKEQIAERDPVKGANPVSAAKGISEKVAKDGTVADVEVNPSESQINKTDSSKTEEDMNSRRTIQMDFTTIGYTKLTPGTVDIGGLGVRYSGKYRIITARHTISDSDYTTECSAVSMTLAAGGQIDPGALIEEDKPEQGEEKLFQGAPVMDEYDKFNQTK